MSTPDIPWTVGQRAEPAHLDADVLVIGGGLAGAWAAVGAARAGGSAILAEGVFRNQRRHLRRGPRPLVGSSRTGPAGIPLQALSL
jgi:hypothetical protein